MTESMTESTFKPPALIKNMNVDVMDKDTGCS